MEPSDAAVLRAPFGASRLAYALGVMLDATDLRDEQDYHRGRLARAWKYLLGTGTAAGLQVSFDPASGRVLVDAGIALDAVGRLIEVPRQVGIRLLPDPTQPGLRNWLSVQRQQDLVNGWYDAPAGPVLVTDVFVRFCSCDHARVPDPNPGPADALDSAMPTRRRDGYEVGLVIREEARFIREAVAASQPAPALPAPDAWTIYQARPTATRQSELDWYKQRILAAWRDDANDWLEASSPARPNRLAEHLAPRSESPSVPGLSASMADSDPTAVGRDTTSVLLARLEIPVTVEPVVGPSTVNLNPAVPSGGPSQPPDNTIRRLVYRDCFFTGTGP